MLLHCVFICAISKEKNCRSPSLYYSIYNRAFLHPPSGPVVAIETSSLFLSNFIIICLDMGSFYFLCFEFIRSLTHWFIVWKIWGHYYFKYFFCFPRPTLRTPITFISVFLYYLSHRPLMLLSFSSVFYFVSLISYVFMLINMFLMTSNLPLIICSIF